MAALTKLQKARLPVLEARRKNREGGRYTQKIEDECNAKLRKLNLAIQNGETELPKKKVSVKKVLA